MAVAGLDVQMNAVDIAKLEAGRDRNIDCMILVIVPGVSVLNVVDVEEVQ